MTWPKQEAPFGNGKRKEFPDALAFAAVLKYAINNKCNVAILAKDKDFHKAVKRYHQVLLFDSLESFTHTLIESDSRMELIRGILGKDLAVVEDAIADEFSNLGFYPAVDINGNGEVSEVSPNKIAIGECKVIAVGDRQCTVAFKAKVDYSAHIECDVEEEVLVEDGYHDVVVTKAGRIHDSANISGVVKLQVDEAWKEIVGIDLLSLDEDDIWVESEPNEYKDYPEDYIEPLQRGGIFFPWNIIWLNGLSLLSKSFSPNVPCCT